MTSAKPNYFPALDGLRLLASINIVMLHLGSSSALAYMADFKWVMPIINAPAFAAGRSGTPHSGSPLYVCANREALPSAFLHDTPDVRGARLQVQRLLALARLKRNRGLRRGGPRQDDSPVAEPFLAPFAHLVHCP